MAVLQQNASLTRCYQRVRNRELRVIRALAEVRQTLAELKQAEPENSTPADADAKKQEARQKVQQCIEAFKRYDKDDSGYIGVWELKSLLEELHGREVEDKEVTKIMKDHDTSRDGRIDFDEFLVIYSYTDQERKQHFHEQMHKALVSDYHGDAGIQQKVRIDGVPMKALKQYLQKEIDETSSCIQFIWAAALFVFFAISVTLHFRFDQMNAIQHAIEWDIEQNANFAFSGLVPFEIGRMGHKSMYDVNSIADFWSWFQMGLVPVCWPQGWDVGEFRENTLARCSGPTGALEQFGWPASGLNGTKNNAMFSGPCPEGSNELQWQQGTEKFFGGDKKVDGRYLLLFSTVGGVRISQERIPPEDCEPPYSSTVHAGQCIPDPLDYWVLPEKRRLLMMDERFVNQPGGETEYLLSRKSQSEVRETLRDLENRMWFSPSTRRIEILFTPYLAKHRILTATYIVFIMNSAGHIQKKIEAVSFFLHPYNNAWLYFVDIVWLLLIVKLFLEESWELGKHLRQLGCIKGFQSYMHLSNLVDWLSIFLAAALIISWVPYLLDLSEIRQIMDQGQALTVGTWADSGVRKRFFSLVAHTAWKNNWLRTLAAAYPFVIVSRFLKAFAYQPRLAMVTKTLSRASVDIFHFAVVFGCVFLVFTMSAFVLWGGDDEYFATFPRAINTVFRIMLGDFDWDDMVGIGRAQAYLWFWSFAWLVNLIMLNMLLAIVMDVYGDVKSGISTTKTLWSQTLEIYRRWWDVRRGHIMSFDKILQSVDPEFLEEDVDDDDYKAIRAGNLVREHGLQRQQADEVLLAAYRLHDQEKNKMGSESQSKKAAHIEQKVSFMHKFMMLQMQRAADIQEVLPKSEMDFLHVEGSAICCSPRSW